MTEVTEVKPDLEDVIVAAYKRGAAWACDNAGAGEFLSKAARDYADFTMHNEANAATVVKALSSHEAMKEALLFYANPETHKSRILGTEWGAPIETDKGDVARAALKEAEGE